MEKCLVTKLKGVVENDSLKKLGQAIVKFRYTKNSTTYYNSIKATSPTVFHYSGSDIHKTNTQEVVDRRIEFGDTVSNVAFNATVENLSDVTVYFDNCYYINSVYFHGLSKESDLSSLDFVQDIKDNFVFYDCDIEIIKNLYNIYDVANNLTRFDLISSSKITEDVLTDEQKEKIYALITRNAGSLSSVQVDIMFLDISRLPALNAVTVFRVETLRGNIEDLIVPKVTELTYTTSSYISGTLEKFVENIRNAGRTSGSIKCPYCIGNDRNIRNNVTLEGKKLNVYGQEKGLINGSDLYINWTPSSINISNTKEHDN